MRARLAAMFVLLLLVVFIVGIGSLKSLRSVNDAAADIRARWLPSAHALGDLNNYSTDFPAAAAARMRAATAGERAAIDQQMQRLDREILAAQAAYRRVAHDAAEQELYRLFDARWREYRQSLNDERSAPWGRAAASEQAYLAASSTLQVLTEINARGERQASALSDRAYVQARNRILSMMSAALLLVVAGMIYVTRYVSLPLVDLAQRMHGLTSDELDAPIRGMERRDEIGEMARAMLVFRGNAIDLAVNRQALARQTKVLEEKLTEEQRLTRVQRNFVSMASHEFGTPLAIIEGHAQRLEAMRDRLSPDDLLTRTHKIRNAVRRMLQLISNLISSARLLDGRIGLAYRPEPTDLALIVRDCCELQKELATSVRIDNRTTSTHITVLGDPGLLSQAIGNLVSNAVKYSPQGKLVSVEVCCEAARVSVRVEDGGIGVPPQDRSHLFESYYRGSNTASVVGSGVGLYLVKAIADLHGGSVTYEPLDTGGSRFILQLPGPLPDSRPC